MEGLARAPRVRLGAQGTVAGTWARPLQTGVRLAPLGVVLHQWGAFTHFLLTGGRTDFSLLMEKVWVES